MTPNLLGGINLQSPQWFNSLDTNSKTDADVHGYNSFSKTGAISKEEFLNTLKKISCQLEESIKCLQPEAEGTKEAYQAKLANKALKGIKELIFFSDFLWSFLLFFFESLLRV